MQYIKMPANYIAISAAERTTIVGGSLTALVAARICYALGRMFKGSTYSTGEEESTTETKAWGSVESGAGKVETGSGGIEQTTTSGWHLFLNIGDFFYGLGDLFKALD